MEKIILIEDNPVERDMFTHMLNSHVPDCHVDGFSSLSALVVKYEEYDLAVVDVQLVYVEDTISSLSRPDILEALLESLKGIVFISTNPSHAKRIPKSDKIKFIVKTEAYQNLGPTITQLISCSK